MNVTNHYNTRRQKKIVTKNETWVSFLYNFFILNPKQCLYFFKQWWLFRNPKPYTTEKQMQVL